MVSNKNSNFCDKANKTIVLTGGGTLGHCTPHFAVLPYLKNYFDDIAYIGSFTGLERAAVEKENIPYYPIETVKLIRGLTVKNLKIPFKLKKSVIDAKKILIKLNPAVVFSKGGFVGLPVTIAAKKLHIPVIIHESDLSMGLANKIAARFSEKTLTTFLPTSKKVKNGEYVGAPVREELFSVTKSEGLKKYGFTGEKPVLLITGGSLGAAALNKLVLSSLDGLLKTFDVLLICGKNNLSGIKKAGFKETEFTDMRFAYAAASVCVSRAGSNTAFELMCLKIPALFIPLPKNASRGDQIENAGYFKSLNVAAVIEQNDLTPNEFTRKIFDLYSHKDYYIKNMTEKNFTPANKKIADILINSAETRLKG